MFTGRLLWLLVGLSYYYLRDRLFLLYTLSCLFHFCDFVPSLLSYLLGTVLRMSLSEEKNLSVGQMSLGDFIRAHRTRRRRSVHVRHARFWDLPWQPDTAARTSGE